MVFYLIFCFKVRLSMHVKDLIEKSLEQCSNVIFPKICLHCNEKTSNNFFCSSCMESLDLIEKSDFKTLSSISYPLAVAFDDMGLISTFLSELKKMRLPALSKVAASYMVCQYVNFGLDFPDMIVPLSETSFGVKYIDVLAKEIAKLMDRPVKKLFFQSCFATIQNAFFSKHTSLQDKKLLLVTDKVDERKLSGAIYNLEKQGLKNINILAFCY